MTWILGESMDMNDGVSKILFLGDGFETPWPATVGPRHSGRALALARHADWQAAQDLTLSEPDANQIPVPTQQPSSRELSWSNTVRFGRNINKSCSEWIILFPSRLEHVTTTDMFSFHSTGNCYLLGFWVLRTTLPHWLFEIHIIMYIVSRLWPVWAVSV